MGGVVQFTYGDDGLDPASLEGDAQPLDFARSWMHAQAISGCHGEGLGSSQVLDFVKQELEIGPRAADQPLPYASAVLTFFEGVCEQLAAVRQRHFIKEESGNEKLNAEHREAVDNVFKITQTHLKVFLAIVKGRYARAKIEPGWSLIMAGSILIRSRFHCRRCWRTIDWGARDSNDSQNFPFCWGSLHERYLGCTSHQRDYQRIEIHSHPHYHHQACGQ